MAYPPRHPFEIAHRVSEQTENCLVSFSCGADSLAALDVCSQFFKRISAFYLYVIPGLSFHEDCIARAERRYPGLTVHRLPHWSLSRLLRTGSMRTPTQLTLKCRSLKYAECEDYARQVAGIDWVGGGQKMCDSLERRGMITRCDGVDEQRKRFYPLAHWSRRYVFSYLKRRRIPLSGDYAILGRSYDGEMDGASLVAIRDDYPADFDKICERFPAARAEVMRFERDHVRANNDGSDTGTESIPEIDEGNRASVADEVPSHESADH